MHHSVIVVGWEALTSSRRYAVAKEGMKHAKSFTEFAKSAMELDRLEGRASWKSRIDANEEEGFDHLLIADLIRDMKHRRSQNDLPGLMKLLRTIFGSPNIGGIENNHLYQQTHFGTKHLIDQFIQEVMDCTNLIRDSDLALVDRREFFLSCLRSHGRTALLLSGGAGLGYYHIGVLKALFEAKCLPTVISGASAGSLISALICTRTDEELKGFFVPEVAKCFTACEEPFRVTIPRWCRKGHLFDVAKWIRALRPLCGGDTTFIEAYRRTGRILNISISSSNKYLPAMVLNYRSTPDVVIYSAVLASSAFPNVIAPVELLAKDSLGNVTPYHIKGKTFVDGTIRLDIPIKEIGKLYDCNFFIVSQVNPHVMPFVYDSRGTTGFPTPRTIGTRMRGGFILALLEKLLKLEMIKWLHFLSQLDLLPTIFGTDWRYVFLQSVKGTVTIVPNYRLIDYLRIITDPTPTTMAQYISNGERSTWHRLTRISNHYRWEQMLSDGARSLDAQYQLENPRSYQQSLANEGTLSRPSSIGKGLSLSTNASFQHELARQRLVTEKFSSSSTNIDEDTKRHGYLHTSSHSESSPPPPPSSSLNLRYSAPPGRLHQPTSSHQPQQPIVPSKQSPSSSSLSPSTSSTSTSPSRASIRHQLSSHARASHNQVRPSFRDRVVAALTPPMDRRSLIFNNSLSQTEDSNNNDGVINNNDEEEEDIPPNLHIRSTLSDLSSTSPVPPSSSLAPSSTSTSLSSSPSVDNLPPALANTPLALGNTLASRGGQKFHAFPSSYHHQQQSSASNISSPSSSNGTSIDDALLSSSINNPNDDGNDIGDGDGAIHHHVVNPRAQQIHQLGSNMNDDDKPFWQRRKFGRSASV